MRKILFIISLLLLPLLPIHGAHAATQPVKILLVPGHDNEVWGAQYGTTKEADMTLALATRIYNILKKDKRFEVLITRDGSTPSGYTKEFADYFATEQQQIIDFEKNAKSEQTDKISSGDFVPKEGVPHHTVDSSVALKLYGINKWADDNKMDAVIHIHFNDYPRPDSWTIGKYTGFVVYFPDGQLANSRKSGDLAADIFSQLHKKYSTSTYPPEKGGLIPDQKLIALGSNSTLLSTVRSVLIEYSYIYEKKFRKKSTREAAYASMAQLTSTGIKNYFFKK